MAANLIVPLPRVVTAILPALADEEGLRPGAHPGLTLDKYGLCCDEQLGKVDLQKDVQKPVIEQVVRLSNTPPLPPPDYATLFQRWTATIGKDGFTGTTAGPLTLHLGRASALENAGICFHRIYGFVYLPGTGLKGLARAFACEVWLGEQPDKAAAWTTITAVFGSAPSPWLNDLAKRHDQPAPKEATSGGIVFHDAWPETWPRLVTDILNSHHAKYYSEGTPPPPGDWEDPIPVYFLSVEPGTKFRFAVAKRRDDLPDERLTLARQWLIGGLTQLGAGAKTASGYGDFTVDPPPPGAAPQDATRTWGDALVKTGRRAKFEATLELVTPAFLAGANQQAEDCDLRPSTLRGQLRWWWRTLHAGFVSVEDLRKMEAAIWGDTKTGGAVRVTVRKVKADPPALYSHPTQQPSGTRYAAYGMDERSRGERKQRQVLQAGATWEVRLAGRVPRGRRGTAIDVLSQATAALWLLTHFGGVGSKSRKGFGSLHATPMAGHTWQESREACVALAATFRKTIGVSECPQFEPVLADPGSVADPGLQADEIDAGRVNPWQLVDRVGAAYSAVCATFKHDERKAAFGLPRKIHGPRDDGPLRHQNSDSWQQPQSLVSPIWPPKTRPDNGRHASPIHLHIGKGADGGLVVRLLAMPAGHLRSRDESVTMLQQFARGFRVEFDALGSASPRSVLPPPPPLGGAVRVEVTLLERKEKTGPNAFSVQEDGKPKGMLVHGTPPSPLPVVGERVAVYREATSNPNNPTYRWSPPTPPSPPTRGPKRR